MSPTAAIELRHPATATIPMRSTGAIPVLEPSPYDGGWHAEHRSEEDILGAAGREIDGEIRNARDGVLVPEHDEPTSEREHRASKQAEGRRGHGCPKDRDVGHELGAGGDDGVRSEQEHSRQHPRAVCTDCAVERTEYALVGLPDDQEKQPHR